MIRISKRLLILVLLIFTVSLIASCGNQPAGVATSPASSQEITESNEVQQDAPVAPEAVSGIEAPVKEVPTKETPTKETPTKETPTKETPAKDTSTKEIPATTGTKQTPEPLSTVMFSIVGDEKKGVILEPASVEWQDGDSVLDTLKRVTKSNRIPLEYRGSGMLSYVEGIANVYEFDHGAASGWLFKVNGQFADKSAGAVKLSKGDIVEWIYSIALSEDPDN